MNKFKSVTLVVFVAALCSYGVGEGMTRADLALLRAKALKAKAEAAEARAKAAEAELEAAEKKVEEAPAPTPQPLPKRPLPIPDINAMLKNSGTLQNDQQNTIVGRVITFLKTAQQQKNNLNLAEETKTTIANLADKIGEQLATVDNANDIKAYINDQMGGELFTLGGGEPVAEETEAQEAGTKDIETQTEAELEKQQADVETATTALATNPPADLQSALTAFAQELKNSTTQAAAIDALAEAERATRFGGRPGGWHGGRGGFGRQGRPEGGRGGHGEHMRLTLFALITELNNPANATLQSPTQETLRFQLIRWAWRINRLQEDGKLDTSLNALAQKAQNVTTKATTTMPPWMEPRGHHGWHGGFGGPRHEDRPGSPGPEFRHRGFGPGKHMGPPPGGPGNQQPPPEGQEGRRGWHRGHGH